MILIFCRIFIATFTAFCLLFGFIASLLTILGAINWPYPIKWQAIGISFLLIITVSFIVVILLSLAKKFTKSKIVNYISAFLMRVGEISSHDYVINSEKNVIEILDSTGKQATFNVEQLIVPKKDLSVITERGWSCSGTFGHFKVNIGHIVREYEAAGNLCFDQEFKPPLTAEKEYERMFEIDVFDSFVKPVESAIATIRLPTKKLTLEVIFPPGVRAKTHSSRVETSFGGAIFIPLEKPNLQENIAHKIKQKKIIFTCDNPIYGIKYKLTWAFEKQKIS